MGDRLEGCELRGLGYEPLARGPDGSILGRVLELDPRTGQDLLIFRDAEQARSEAERRLREEAKARAKAEQERASTERGRDEEIAARRDAESEITCLKARVASLESEQ